MITIDFFPKSWWHIYSLIYAKFFCNQLLILICLTFGTEQFNDIINTMFSSSATVCMIVAVVLDNTLKASRKDRGLLWWDKFRSFGSDPRNLEFYRLPMGLNKFFPAAWWFTINASITCFTLFHLKFALGIKDSNW